MNTIPANIIQQLGGGSALFMIGAKNVAFSSQTNTLSFKFMKSEGTKANYITVQLQANDTYAVTFKRLYGSTVTTIKSFHDVYADQLQGILESTTGLRTSLTKVFS